MTQKHAWDKRHYDLIDRETGEKVEGGVPVLVRGKVRWYDKEYMLMFQESVDKLAEDPDMTGEAWRVLMKMVAKLGMKNWVHVEQKTIAEELKMQKSHVSRAVKKLLEKKIIEEGPRIGKSKSYRLSVDLGWKGPGKEYGNLTLLKATGQDKEKKAKTKELKKSLEDFANSKK